MEIDGVFPKINKHQLFDLETDPHEIWDLAAQRPEQVERLMKQLKAELKANGDTASLRSENPHPAEFIPPNAKSRRASAGSESKN